MKKLHALNKQTAPKSVMPERIIQFGEGNFLRAFVDWIVWNMDAKTNFNGSVVVVQPIERGMVDWLNGQDCLYHVNLQGRLNGEAVNSLERIDVISRALNPYSQNAAFMALAEQPEIRFVISNTTEAGIAFDDTCIVITFEPTLWHRMFTVVAVTLFFISSRLILHVSVVCCI